LTQNAVPVNKVLYDFVVYSCLFCEVLVHCDGCDTVQVGIVQVRKSR